MVIQDDSRPAPEALLEEARKERRGKLKIFLGAYPGVGKTYAMLEAGHERRREGVDVAAGVVETHGRMETEALLRDMEIIPRLPIAYRGRVFGEFDLDALLRRNPKLALVDELAHTNVPGSRHEKRHQDVEELLAAGIDVFTTLNIQHIESLNDVVARISRIEVRETLPDKVLELASEIELVDLPPDDLMQRLRQGKVYVPEQASRAMSHFFSKSNLTALRELSMRVAAERVDAQMINLMRAHAIPGPWPAQERLLVCLNESPIAKTLVRTARRMAERQHMPWIVAYVRTPQHDNLSEAAKSRIAEAMRLAERLEGEVITLHAESGVVDELLAFARRRNVSRILVGRERKRLWSGFSQETVSKELLKKAGRFEVVLVPLEDDEAGRARIGGNFFKSIGPWQDYFMATLAVLAATAAAYAVWQVLPLPNIFLIYLAAVLVVAMYFGQWASIFASVLSVLSYNFFFTPPFFTLTVIRRDLITLIIFLLVAFVVGNLAARLKAQVESMRRSAQRTANLYAFSRKIAAAASLDDVLWAAVHHVASIMQSHVLVLLPDSETRLQIAAGYPPEDHLEPKDWGAARWAWEHGKQAGWKSETLPASNWLFLPLKTRQGPIGLLGVCFEDQQQPLAPDQSRLLEALADQVAVAVERTNLVAGMEETRMLTETGQLRSALLFSVSHDLRRPLMSIIRAATALASHGDKISKDYREELTKTLLQESENVNRFFQNLLDMTRTGYGALLPKRQWSDLKRIAENALRQLGKALSHRKLEVKIADNLPPIFIDPALIEQILVNIIDNTARHTRTDGVIHLEVLQDNTDAVIRVRDESLRSERDTHAAAIDSSWLAGLSQAQLAASDLTLAICRGVVEAHGGSVSAKKGFGGAGTAVEIRLPLTVKPAVAEGRAALLDSPGEVQRP